MHYKYYKKKYQIQFDSSCVNFDFSLVQIEFKLKKYHSNLI